MLMLTSAQRDLVRDKGTILGRSLVGLLFVVGGINMLVGMGVDNTATYFASLGIPLAGIVVWLVIVLKIVAGSAIIIGKRVGVASAALILFTFFATIFGHIDLSAGVYETTAILKNFAIIGALLYLMAYGPGGTNTKKLA